jgi:hypothetical protein
MEPMALDDDKFGELKGLLRKFAANTSFRARVLALWKEPFSNPESRNFISLEDARQERTKWPWSLLAGLAIFILLYLVSTVAGQFHPGVLDLLQRSIAGGLPQATLHSFPWWQWTIVFCVIMGASIYVGPMLFKSPGNHPDPLFGRILQAGLKEPKPLSNQLILRILQDHRFTAVLERALERTLPESEFSTRWNSFVQRLAEALRYDEGILELLQNHTEPQSSSVIELHPIDQAITRSLIYTTRRMLFETMVADPDLRYICDGMALWHRGLIKWIAAIDFGKAKELFGKQGEKGTAHGADIQGIANVALVVLVIVMLEGWATRGPSEPSKDESHELAKLSDDFQDLREAILKALVESCKARREQPVCPAPAAINISPLKSDPAIINVPAPTINIPSKLSVEVTSPPVNIPSKLSVDITSNSSGEKVAQPGKEEPVHEQTTGGDTFLTLGPDAPAGDRASPQSAKFTVDEGKGVTCSYVAALAQQDRWPPDPVAVRVSAADPQNAETCPKLDAQQPERILVYAGSKALYNGLLRGYVGVEEMHRKWLGIGKDFVVLRIHAQSSP